MKRVLLFKHVAHEVLGTLTPTLRDHRFRMRYVNFERNPGAKPCLDRYDGLVVFGGWMGVYESERYPHIKVECKLIEQALKRGIPVLGICLGSQILAHVLGSSVRKHEEKEVGWSDVHLTEAGKADPLLRHFQPTEKLFQMHGDTFDIPNNSVHLAHSEVCPSQAFRYGSNAYGFQFHLEVNHAMIARFLTIPSNRTMLENFGGKCAVAKIEQETSQYLPRSEEISRAAFVQYVRLFGEEVVVPSFARIGHGKTAFSR